MSEKDYIIKPQNKNKLWADTVYRFLLLQKLFGKGELI